MPLQDSFQPASAQPYSAPRPDEEWKQALAMTLEAGLRSVADEVKGQINDELAKERERLDADQHMLLKTIRQLGNEQLQVTLEREWQERWWAAGYSPDQAWSGSVISEQQAILDEIERMRKNMAPATSSQSYSPRPNPAENHPSLSLPPSFQLQPAHSAYHPAGPTSTPSLSNDKVEHINESKLVSRSTTPTDLTDSTTRSIRRNPGVNARPVVQEIWKPSVTHEDDAEMSRTFRFATQAPSTVGAKPTLPPSTSPPIVNMSVLPLIPPMEDAEMSRSSTPVGRSDIGSDTSYSKAPCTLSVAFTEPLDALSSNVHRESSSIESAVQKWTGSNQAQEEDSNDQRLGNQVGIFLPQAPRYATYLPSEDSSCAHVPPSSGGRSIFKKKKSAPSVAPGEDAQISRVLAPEIQGRASATSLLEAPCTLSIAFTDPLDALSGNVDQEQLSIYSVDQEWISSDRTQEGNGEGGIHEHGHTDDCSVQSSNQTFEDAISRPQTPPLSPTTHPQLWNNSRVHAPDTQPEEEGKWKEKWSRELEMKQKEEELKRREQEVNSREIMVKQKEEDIRRKEAEVRIIEKGARRKESEAKRKKEAAERKEEEVQRRTKEAILKSEEMRKKEEELRKREDELGQREDILNRREAEMRRREDDRLQEEFRKQEEGSRRQRAGEKKEEVRERWIPAWLRPTPSPRGSCSSGPDHSGRNTPAAASPPTDGVGMSASSHRNPTSDFSLTSTQPASITDSQSPSNSKPTGLVTLTPKPPASSTPNPPPKDAEFHQRQARQARRHEEQLRRRLTRLHERQAEASRTMSKEESMKLFEVHSDQWGKIQTSGSLTWGDFPWPTFKKPKGPNDLTLHAISEYMLSSFHPQDRATKEHIKDYIRRWDPDRVNSRLLPKVEESERARVFEGVRSVERILNDLLRSH